MDYINQKFLESGNLRHNRGQNISSGGFTRNNTYTNHVMFLLHWGHFENLAPVQCVHIVWNCELRAEQKLQLG
jgi:hypothetical protein